MTTINQSDLDNSVYFGMQRQQAGHVFVPNVTGALIATSTISNAPSDPTTRLLGVFNGSPNPVGVSVAVFYDFSQFDASVNPAAAALTRQIFIRFADTTVPTASRNFFRLNDGIQGLPGVIVKEVTGTLSAPATPTGGTQLNIFTAGIPYGSLSETEVRIILPPNAAVYAFSNSAGALLSTQAVGESASVKANATFTVDDLIFP